MEPLTGARIGHLRKAVRLAIEPGLPSGSQSEATLHLWVPGSQGGEPTERKMAVDQFLRGVESIPGLVQMPRLAGVPAWEAFVKALKTGDLLQVEWTADSGGVAGSGGQWRARLIGQRNTKQVGEFVIRTTASPGAAPAAARTPGTAQTGAARPAGVVRAGIREIERQAERQQR
jgi:hypothetical protein